MSTSSSMPQFYVPQVDFLTTAAAAAESEDDVRLQVWGLLSTLYPRRQLVERRREHRYPYPCLLPLTPVAADGITPAGESVVVVGKHLSERGLSFYHTSPIPHRRVIASLETTHGTWVGFLVDLTWCRFTRHRWYESGGKFLQTVASPLNDEPADGD